MQHLAGIGLILALVLMPACQQVRPASPTRAIINGVLIDGAGDAAVPDAAVVIQAGYIVAVGPRSKLNIPKDAQVIDARGGTILPGFIDAHVHNAYNTRNLQAWARAGVTTVRDLGAPPAADLFETRDSMLRQPGAARLIAAGPIVTVPGGYPISGNQFPALTVTSPQDASQKVAQLLDEGADLVNIALETGPQLSPEEILAIVKVAHEHGTLVSAHVTSSRYLEPLLDAGVDDLAHMVVDPLPDALIERMINDDVYVIPTLEVLSKHMPANGEGAGAIDNLRRFVKAGGKVALGTDAGYYSDIAIGMPFQEMALMHLAGMTPMQIILAATRNAAHVCNRDKLLGTLEVGKRADILVVAGDPLADIMALKNVRLVLKEGMVVRNDFAQP